MKNLVFYLVDVFAEEKYSGNQLAIITGANELSDHQMQRIANETHFSETAFVLSNQRHSGGYDVRIFTPKTEVPFAGHPTLGTAYVINRFISAKEEREIVLNLRAGQIHVNFEKNPEMGDFLWMKQLPPVFGKTFEVTTFCDLLGLEKSDFESKYPIQEVSTGLPFIIIPLKRLDAVKRAKVNQKAQLELMKETQAGILLFCPETYKKENHLNVRVFVDAFGIPEDPATGSGNGCLAGYLLKHQFFGSTKIDIRVEQGFEIDRPSLLRLKAMDKEGEIQVQVGGHVLLIAKGELL